MRSAIRWRDNLQRRWPIARLRAVRPRPDFRRPSLCRAQCHRSIRRQPMARCGNGPCARIACIARQGMRATAQLQIAIALCAITACTTNPAAKDVPAIIVRPDAQSRADLQSAVSKALNRTSVTLADDALTRDSSLSMERARLRDPQQGIAQGRETRMPEHFRLVESGHHCVLIHERTGQRMELANTRCAAKR